MKLLVIGGNGMAGHMLVRYIQALGGIRLFYTTRDTRDADGLWVDVTDIEAVAAIIQAVRPDLIVNMVGVLNQAAENHPEIAYEVNGLFPHRLQKYADRIGARVIHISTDCVFAGDRGRYMEEDVPDSVTVYGRSKALGEIRADRHLTIRTSIIGPEIRQECIGLLHWFMQQKGEVSGYCEVLWNGVTTLELAKAIVSNALSSVSGLIHLVHPEPISKHDLLHLFQQVFHQEDVKIVPDHRIVLDRTLVNTRADVLYAVPHYSVMLRELAEWMRVP